MLGPVQIIRGHDHAVWHAGEEILDVSRTDPDDGAYMRSQYFFHHCGQAFSRADFEAFHTENKGHFGQSCSLYLAGQIAQLLGTDTDDDYISPGQRPGQVCRQGNISGQGHIFIAALGNKLC